MLCLVLVILYRKLGQLFWVNFNFIKAYVIWEKFDEKKFNSVSQKFQINFRTKFQIHFRLASVSPKFEDVTTHVPRHSTCIDLS